MPWITRTGGDWSIAISSLATSCSLAPARSCLTSACRNRSRVPACPHWRTLSPHDAELTADGAVLGTFPYMAPEQLEGRQADVRTDVFAFGATVFEMATGQRAFQGDAAATLIGAILHTDPPPVSTHQPLAPPALDRIVARCLAKDPKDRWQTARDLMLELKAIAENDAPLAAHTQRRIRFAFAAAAVFALSDDRRGTCLQPRIRSIRSVK